MFLQYNKKTRQLMLEYVDRDEPHGSIYTVKVEVATNQETVETLGSLETM